LRPMDASTESWIASGVCATIVGIALLFSLPYRWSLKLSAVIYLPLLWLVWTSFPPEVPVDFRLREILRSEAEQARRVYAFVVLFVLTFIPFMLFVHFQQPILFLQEKVHLPLVDYWLFTGTVNGWHVARVISAILTLALWLYAAVTVRRLSEG